MTIGENVQAILNLLRGWSDLPSLISSLGQKVDVLQANTDTRFTNVDNALADLRNEIGVPETGSLNPQSATITEGT